MCIKRYVEHSIISVEYHLHMICTAMFSGTSVETYKHSRTYMCYYFQYLNVGIPGMKTFLTQNVYE